MNNALWVVTGLGMALTLKIIVLMCAGRLSKLTWMKALTVAITLSSIAEFSLIITGVLLVSPGCCSLVTCACYPLCSPFADSQRTLLRLTQPQGLLDVAVCRHSEPCGIISPLQHADVFPRQSQRA